VIIIILVRFPQVIPTAATRSAAGGRASCRAAPTRSPRTRMLSCSGTRPAGVAAAAAAARTTRGAPPLWRSCPCPAEPRSRASPASTASASPGMTSRASTWPGRRPRDLVTCAELQINNSVSGCGRGQPSCRN